MRPTSAPGRHHQHRHVHGDPHRPGRLRPVPHRRRGLNEAGGAGWRGPRPTTRRRLTTTSVRRRFPRSDEPHRLDLAGRERPRGPQRQLRELAAAYREAAEGQVRGGARTCSSFETIFDTLNAKAAIFAIEEAFEGLGRRIRRSWFSGTIVDASGRTLSGRRWRRLTSVRHARPMLVGLNCCARREAASRARRRCSGLRGRAARRVPERGPAQRARRLRQDHPPDVDDARRMGPREPDQSRRLVLRRHARAPARHRRRGRRRPAARRSRRAPTRPASRAASHSRSRCPVAPSSTSASAPTSPAPASSPG